MEHLNIYEYKYMTQPFYSKEDMCKHYSKRSRFSWKRHDIKHYGQQHN